MAISARIDELRKKFDENPRRYFAPLANEYRKAGDPGQAIFICETYLPQQPGHMSGHIVFGQALYELNRLDEARSVFETALSLDPENLIALRHLGDIARKTGDNTAARNWYQRVLEADPRNDEIAQIVASLAYAPDASAAEQSDAGVTAETSTTLVMEPPVLPQVPDSQRTPARGNLGLVEHFDSGLSAPAMSPPPLATPSLSDTGSVFDLTEKGPAELRMSGPFAQVRQDQAPAIPEPTFSGKKPALPTPPFELTAVSESNTSAEDLTFEADSLAITAKPEPQAEPVEDDGHLDGAFVDESAFEPFSLGSPIPEFDEPPARAVAETPATPAAAAPSVVNEAESAPVAEEPPPLPFVEMRTVDAIAAPVEEAPPTAPEDDELAMFLARHTQHAGIATPPSVPAQPEAVEPLPPIETPTESAGAASAQTEAVEAPVAAEVEETLATAPEPDAVEAPVVEATVTVSEVMALPEPVWGALETSAVIAEPPVETAEPHAEAASEEAEAIAEPTVAEAQLEANKVEVASEEPVHDESAVETHAAEIGGVIAAAGLVGVAAEAVSHLTPAASVAAAPVEPAESAPAAPVEPSEPSSHDEHPAATPELPAEEPSVEPVVADAPSGPPEAFVTETMAELYLQQGHLEPALDIYKKLVEQRPNDPQLRERLGAIERNLHGTPAAVSAEEPVPVEPAVVGPTIRDFLSVFATRTNPVAETHPEEAPADGGNEDAWQGAAATAAEDAIHPAEASAAPTAAGGGEHGSIDALFHGADAHVTDVNAATMLSEAFAPDDGRPVQPIVDQAESSPPAPAAPSQRADAEGSGDGFSFDQFFARDAGRAVPPTPRDSESAPGDAADVAQFNQWLSGLKKPS